MIDFDSEAALAVVEGANMTRCWELGAMEVVYGKRRFHLRL